MCMPFQREIVIMIALFVCALAMTSATSSSFNFGRYHKAMLEQAKVRYPDDTCAIRFMEYCLIDIDGDGKAEVWVTSPHRGTVPL